MTPTERRRFYKNNIVKTMGGKCVCCGYNKSNRALELHHINPNDKNFSISSKAYYAWSKLENELKKCILVCANCHAEIEDKILECPEHSSFNQKIFDEIADEILSKKTKNKCIDCGKEISAKAIRCSKCDGLNRRVNEHPTKE